jgi:membrane protein
MVICPFFLITSSSITVWLSHVTQTVQSNVFVEVVNPLLLFILKFFPFLLGWILFTFVYFFLPNTKVYMRSAVIAGIIAGTAFQIWQWLYIKFQIGASSYGAIYGSFAALPLFMIWLQISWLILLAGAELAFEIENDLFIPYRRTVYLSSKAAALLVCYRCIEAFVRGNPPQTDRTLAHELGISLNHLHTLLEALQKERILSAVVYKDRAIGYQPARAIEAITFTMVCNAIDKSNELLASVRDSTPYQRIQEYLKESNSTLEGAAFNQPIYSVNQEEELHSSKY